MYNLPRFLRRYIRRHSRPKKPTDALETRSKISLFYTLVTWNLLGFIVYKAWKHNWISTNETKGLTGARYYAALLGKEDMVVMKYEGLSKVGEWNLANEKKKHGHYLTEGELEETEPTTSEREPATKN